MILQNKKTGVLGVLEATTYHGGRPDNIIEVYEKGMGAVMVLAQYKTLEELLEEWEDYKPKESPKLNGEVREIVRHWASLHGYDKLRVGFDERATQTIFWVESPDTRKHIEFLGAYVADDFDAGVYSIEELCGAPEPLEPTFIDLDERIKEKEGKWTNANSNG